jgi:hypothetical protein
MPAMRPIRLLRVLLPGLALSALAAPPADAGSFGDLPFRPPAPLPDDRRDIPPPEERPVNVWEDAWQRQFTTQFSELFQPARLVRMLTGNPKQALNADAFGDVANSSWYVRREGAGRLMGSSACPDTAGEWTVFKAKMQGKAPGMFVKDSSGRRFIVKFDPKGHGGLSTGAEVVNARFLFAAGYNVPANCIVHFHPGRVKVGEGVKLVDRRGRTREMTAADLEEVYALVDRRPDGLIRAAASAFIPGKGLGPFLYEGTRPDDPNDIVPHEHRREVRALRVIYAWLKRFDINSGNTYDSYAEEDGRRFVKHYLIDFGGDLGASLYGPTPPARGHENVFDPHQIGINLLTLGLFVPPWERGDTAVAHPEVGRYHSKGFHPAKFKFIVPAKAFENLTNLDGYWGARKVMAFDDSLIRNLVEEGRYRDPEAVDWFVERIKERRDITGRYWFGKVAPLDDFRTERTPDGGGTVLRFQDLSVRYGLEAAAEAEYQAVLLPGDGSGVPLPAPRLIKAGEGLPLPPAASVAASGYRGRPALAAEFRLRRNRAGAPGEWSKAVRVHLEGDAAAEAWTVIGAEREE